MTEVQICLALWASILTIATVVSGVMTCLQWAEVGAVRSYRRYSSTAYEHALGWSVGLGAVGAGSAICWAWFWMIHLNVV